MLLWLYHISIKCTLYMFENNHETHYRHVYLQAVVVRNTQHKVIAKNEYFLDNEKAWRDLAMIWNNYNESTYQFEYTQIFSEMIDLVQIILKSSLSAYDKWGIHVCTLHLHGYRGTVTDWCHIHESINWKVPIFIVSVRLFGSMPYVRDDNIMAGSIKWIIQIYSFTWINSKWG